MRTKFIGTSDAANLITKALEPSGLEAPISRTTVLRWMTDGFDGVKLKSLQVGNRRVTSWEWIQEFFVTYIKAYSDRDIDTEVEEARQELTRHPEEVAG